MLLIPLDAAGNGLPSLPAPFFFTPSADGGSCGKVCRVPKHFPLFLKLYKPLFNILNQYVITFSYL